MNKKLAIILLVLFWTGSAFGGNIEVDPQLSNYSKQGGVSGNVSSVGSGEFELAGLPFTPSYNTSGGEVMINYANITGGSTYHLSTYINTTPHIKFYSAEDNSSWAGLNYSYLSTNTEIYFTATYFTDS